MKTPRELILERHRAAQAHLDEIRARAIDEALAPSPSATESVTAPTGWLASFWREVVLPGRWAWSGMAAAWAVIVVLQGSSSIEVSVPSQRAERSSPDVLALLKEQHLLRIELLDGPAAVSMDNRQAPGPKSESLSPCGTALAPRRPEVASLA
jgi:hypothetical protein